MATPLKTTQNLYLFFLFAGGALTWADFQEFSRLEQQEARAAYAFGKVAVDQGWRLVQIHPIQRGTQGYYDLLDSRIAMLESLGLDGIDVIHTDSEGVVCAAIPPDKFPVFLHDFPGVILSKMHCRIMEDDLALLSMAQDAPRLIREYMEAGSGFALMDKHSAELSFYVDDSYRVTVIVQRVEPNEEGEDD